MLRGETAGRDRAEAWTGRRFTYFGPDADAYRAIAEQLDDGGHGTAALIVNGWPPHLGTGMIGGSVLVIDRENGQPSIWPRLAGPHVARMYREARAAG